MIRVINIRNTVISRLFTRCGSMPKSSLSSVMISKKEQESCIFAAKLQRAFLKRPWPWFIWIRHAFSAGPSGEFSHCTPAPLWHMCVKTIPIREIDVTRSSHGRDPPSGKPHSGLGEPRYFTLDGLLTSAIRRRVQHAAPRSPPGPPPSQV